MIKSVLGKRDTPEQHKPDEVICNMRFTPPQGPKRVTGAIEKIPEKITRKNIHIVIIRFCVGRLYKKSFILISIATDETG